MAGTTSRKKLKSSYSYGIQLALLIVDARTGAITKRVSLFSESSDSPQIHGKNSHASPTPVFAGSRLYVHFGHQGTACTTRDGDVIWKNDSLGYKPVHGNGGSPVVIDDLLILTRDGADISETTALTTQADELITKLLTLSGAHRESQIVSDGSEND